MSDTSRNWEKYLEPKIKDKDLLSGYLTYVNRLLDANVPIIFEFIHLSKLLGVERAVLASIVHNPEKFYYDFNIPKRSGGLRLINSPYPVLMEIQRWINNHILIVVSQHDNSYGFKKGNSIIDNVQKHLGKKSILKMDLKDFFHSIQINRIISIFRYFGYTELLSYQLAKICTYNKSLPQGAPTSPTLSNIIAKRLDFRLTALAEKYNLNYSRYADDMCFSGEYIPISFINIVEEISKDERFLINESKTKLISGFGRKKIVTGISVNSSEPKLPKQYKRKLRMQVYYLLKYGLYDQIKKYNDYIYLERIIGKLIYWRYVEKDATFPQDSINRLRKLDK